MWRVLFLSLCVNLLHGSIVIGEMLHRRQFLGGVPENKGKAKVVFLDADSTLRITKSGEVTPHGAFDYVILPGVVESLKSLNSQDYILVIVSNQGDVPKKIAPEVADAALFNMVQEFKRLGVNIHYYDFAEKVETVEGADPLLENRKPGIGMGLLFEKNLRKLDVKVDKSKSMMIGDSAYARPSDKGPGDIRPDGRPGFNFSNTDRLFAENYGVSFFEPQEAFGWATYGVELIEKRKDLKKLLKNIGKKRCAKNSQ